MRKKITITRENFLNWYFGGSDQEQKSVLYLLGQAIEHNFETGFNDFKLNIYDLWEECTKYSIPVCFFENMDPEDYRELWLLEEELGINFDLNILV